MTKICGFPYPIYDQALNGVEEGKARMGGGRDEEVASSKKNRNRAKIDTLFMTKTDEKPYPLGPHIPI